MIGWLRALSLRWKFMLAPVLGLLVMATLAAVLAQSMREQDRFLTQILNVDFERAQAVMQLSNRIAENHTRIYEQLRVAETATDEGAFYDAGRVYLNEIHRVESRLQELLDRNELEPRETDVLAHLLNSLAAYRLQVTNALLTATVDLSLAKDLMSDSTRQHNLLNSEFLTVNRLMQEQLNQRLLAHKKAIDRHMILVAILVVAAIVGILVLSGILSRVLSRDLRNSISRLSELVARQQPQGIQDSASSNEMTMLTAAIEGVHLNQTFLEDARRELRTSNERLFQSNTVILEREAAMKALNQELEGKISELNTTIAERDLAEEALRRSQRLEAIGQLTGGIAHDFNNLLSVMVCNADMLEQLGDKDAAARHNVEAIVKAAERGASLTQRLLAFSRKQPLSPRPTKVNALVLGLEEMLRRSLGETVALRTDLAAEDSIALIDPHQFENALINLAINARDAMPKGGTLTIETAGVTLDDAYASQDDEVTAGDYVKVTVSDNGTGMAPEVLSRVFEPFFTTKDVGEGSGLGLSMVYGFVKQSSGHITIQSVPGRGTKIELFMPQSLEAVAQPQHSDRPDQNHGGSERLLVVEDDDDIRDVATTILRSQGYSVSEARNCSEALKCLSNGEPFDLLFTDMVLPGGMNGVEIAREARRVQSGIKVLYTSGYASTRMLGRDELSPGDNLINKPYRRAELLQRVRAALDD